MKWLKSLRNWLKSFRYSPSKDFADAEKGFMEGFEKSSLLEIKPVIVGTVVGVNGDTEDIYEMMVVDAGTKTPKTEMA